MLVLIVLLGIFACGMVQEACKKTYEMETVYTSTNSYIVVMDTRTSRVKIKEVRECDNVRFFNWYEVRLLRYGYGAANR